MTTTPPRAAALGAVTNARGVPDDYLRSRWDDAVAAALDPVARLVYRSNLFGADPRPVAVMAIAAAADGPALTREVYGGDLIWTDWQRPGFDLGLKLERICREHPNAQGVILGGHGLICWADDDRECYERTLALIRRAEDFLNARDDGALAFGGPRVQPLPEADRRRVLVDVLPWLRGRVSRDPTTDAPRGALRQIATVEMRDAVLEFVNSRDAQRLAELGTSCPDHFLRTKIKPLYLDWDPQAEDAAALKSKLE